MRISDWSSDVCSSDLRQHAARPVEIVPIAMIAGGKANDDVGTGGHRHFGERQGGDGPPPIERLRAGGTDLRLRELWCELAVRQEARREGNECVSMCISRWSPYHQKNKAKDNTR